MPRNGLLIYLARPNSDEYLIGEDTEIGEDTYIWGYVLPDDSDIRAATGWVNGTANVFYTATGVPIVALATEIAAAVLPANVVFSLIDAMTQTGKLAIYTAETTAAVLAKARSVLRDESINYLFYGRTAIAYDPQDLASMHQDAAGTLPVYRPGSGAVDPPVGLALDKSGGGHHASQNTTTARPTLSGRYNLLLATETLSTQSVTTVATTYTLRFEDTGTVTISGTATGVLSAGTHTITCTEGTLTLTVAGSVTKADLRVKRDGSNLPAYQRVDDANTYDTNGFPLYLRRDKVDDDLIVQAPAITGSWAHGTIDGPVLGTVAIPAGEYRPFGTFLADGLETCTQWIAIDGALTASEQAVLERYVKAKSGYGAYEALMDIDIYSIGTPGTAGFGVGVAPELPAGMSELPTTRSIFSSEYGNYQYSDGSICCFIPAFFYKYGTGTNGLAVNRVDIKPYSFFASLAEANASGYALHRAFYNGGTIRSGFFIDKFPNSANGTVASSKKNGIPLSSAVRGALVGSSFGEMGVAANNSGAIDLAKRRGTGWHCTSLFEIRALSLLQLAHGQASDDNTYCAWYNAAGVTNFPKGCNNGTYGDVNDNTITYQPDGNGTHNCPLTGSANLPAKVSHNGQECGVMEMNGVLYDIAIGLTSDGTDYYLLNTGVDVAAMTSGTTLATDLWSAASLAANYTNIGSSWGAMDNAGGNKGMGSASQVLSAEISGVPWMAACAGIPLVGGVSGSNMFGKDYFYPKLVNTLCPLVGMLWNSYSYAGCWSLYLNDSHSTANHRVGFRSALYSEVAA